MNFKNTKILKVHRKVKQNHHKEIKTVCNHFRKLQKLKTKY